MLNSLLLIYGVFNIIRWIINLIKVFLEDNQTELVTFLSQGKKCFEIDHGITDLQRFTKNGRKFGARGKTC